MATRHDPSGSLAALALGVAALVASPAPLGQTAAPAAKTPEVVITAQRESDALLVARVEQAMENDPYLFAPHINVSAENGVVRIEGIVTDRFDMLQLLRIARRVAGKRRVINEIEFVDPSYDHD